MAIKQRQFEQLTAMGIDLWQLKQQDTHKSVEHEIKHQPTELKTLSASVLFQDILQSLGLTIGEISQQADGLNLSLFNWRFSSEPSLNFEQNVLTTPDLSTIAGDAKLKQQLWQLFYQHNLICH